MEGSLDLRSFHNRLGLLSGVWFTNQIGDPPDRYWEDQEVQYLYFMLDGVIYRAQEDPDDGYRSHLRDLIVVDQMPINVWQPAEEVMGHLAEKNSERIGMCWGKDKHWGNDECFILQLISTATTKVVLEIGTDYADDYYPCFVASFTPYNMGINERRANLLVKE